MFLSLRKRLGHQQFQLHRLCVLFMEQMLSWIIKKCRKEERGTGGAHRHAVLQDDCS